MAAVVTLASGFSPWAIVVDAAGNVYATDQTNNEVQKIPAGGGSPVVLSTGYGSPTGIAIDNDGDLFVIDDVEDLVKEIPAVSGTTTVVASGFANPIGIAIDYLGNMYVSGAGANTIKYFEPVGGYYLNMPLPAGLNFDTHTGIFSGTPILASGAQNYIVTGYNDVSISGVGQINIQADINPLPVISYSTPQSYPPGTAITPLAPASEYVNSPGFNSIPLNFGSGFNGPTGVATDASGNVYVADPINNKVQKFPAGGGAPVTLGSGFSGPFGLAVDNFGDVFVADQGNNAVKEILVGGGLITLGSGFSLPTGVAVDANGNVYVADYNNNAVKMIPAGNGTPVTLSSGFSLPVGVAVDASGDVFVADRGDNAVYKIPAGSSSKVAIGSGYSSPYGVAIDASGNIFIADNFNSAVKWIAPGTSTPVVIGSGFGNPEGVAVDGAGNVYIADFSKKVVRQIVPVGGYFLNTSLPLGLTFSYSTGVISGTPTSTSPATNYTVTAYNNAGGSAAVVNIKVSAASIAELSGLTISNGTLSPGFASNFTSYSATVANSVSSVTLTPTASIVGSTIQVNGSNTTSGSVSSPVTLSVGTNNITTVVTSPDGTNSKAYVITVTRQGASNDNLSGITVSNGTLSPAFATGTNSYTDAVGAGLASITITPTAADPTATITVNGVAVTSGSPSSQPLVAGSNTISIVVTAHDGVTKQTYTIVVKEPLSTNANLTAFKPTPGPISPAFSPTTTSYTETVNYAVTSLTITPTTVFAGATVKVNGTSVASGAASGPIALAVGSNTINTVVTAQDGVTTKTYTLTVTRSAALKDAQALSASSSAAAALS